MFLTPKINTLSDNARVVIAYALISFMSHLAVIAMGMLAIETNPAHMPLAQISEARALFFPHTTKTALFKAGGWTILPSAIPFDLLSVRRSVRLL